MDINNAAETAAWVQDQGYLSLRLVTATYHMPRSLLEFRRTMPTVEIIAHPVFPETFKRANWWFWPGSASLVVTEYVKYLIAGLRGAASAPAGCWCSCCRSVTTSHPPWSVAARGS